LHVIPNEEVYYKYIMHILMCHWNSSSVDLVRLGPLGFISNIHLGSFCNLHHHALNDAAKIIENTQLIHHFASSVTVDQFQTLQAHPIHISLNTFLECQSGLLLGCCKNWHSGFACSVKCPFDLKFFDNFPKIH